ncbi:hypothetical protein GGI11_001431 [Coemansia sp. RSA 2049]|nr:hypothetical protein GGI11_001431 [Coemansia sp. RSA 2049]
MYKSKCLCCNSTNSASQSASQFPKLTSLPHGRQPHRHHHSSSHRHSRSSSETTIVATSPMLVPRMSRPSTGDSIASSPSMGPAAGIAIHCGSLTGKEFMLGGLPFRDSGASMFEEEADSDDGSGSAADSDEIDVPMSECGDDGDDGVFAASEQLQTIFDMDALEKHHHQIVSPEIRSPFAGARAPVSLNPDDLAYHHTTKPQPWTVRPLDVYNSHRAQIRAIDDGDNAFYP